ncbi:hypothetical protein EYC55_06530 [Xanthomonas oryzae]|nr:hypothetical protein XocBAI21_10680 [Xanthomonas oryzae pv. oryzicola]QBG95214.1 hypothetical protein EYC55_06530 [Xanthomonas oryzae]
MFVESIGNAPRNVTDIHVFAAVAHVHGVPLMVNTLVTLRSMRSRAHAAGAPYPRAGKGVG